MSKATMERIIDLNLIYFVGDEQAFEPRNVSLSVALYSEVPADGDIDDAQMDFNLSYAKILTLVEAVVADSIVVSAFDYANNVDLLEACTNNIILLPVVSESVLSAALFLKFSSIVDDFTVVDSVTLTDHKSNVRYRQDSLDQEVNYAIMPNVSYVGEFPLWDEPWWCRPDTLTYDGGAHDEEEQASFRDYVAKNEDVSEKIWGEVESSIRTMYDAPATKEIVSTENGEVISVDFSKSNKTVH